jgi:hypothetical protein
VSAPNSPAPDSADVAIVGAGAAGLAAAIFAAEAAPAARIVVLEGARSIGAKILISGGGRCNVTHHAVAADDFNGVRPVVRNVLAAFGVAATVEWFASLGIELKREETGKLFPVSNKAATVVSALVARCRALGVTLTTGCRVGDVTREGTGFRVVHGDGAILDARHVIMATGGRSLPRTGSDGAGWQTVRGLGHTVTATHQALVPLVLAPDTPFAELAGVSHPAELTTVANGTRVDRRAGSLLWTHVGISGPVVMDASRHWVIAADDASAPRPELRMSIYPGESFETVDRRLTAIGRERPKLSLARFVGEQVPERAATTLVRLAGIEPATPIARLTRDERRRVAHGLTDLALPVERGWNYAEVTAGGVPLAEIDYRTMASRVAPGLYLIGEMLDCDGRIGGFNFQWAWATGHLAGRAVARTLRTEGASP